MLWSSSYQRNREKLSCLEKEGGAVLHVAARCPHSVKGKVIGCPWDLCVAHLLQLLMATCHQLAGCSSSISGVLFHWQTSYCMGAVLLKLECFLISHPYAVTPRIPVGCREMLWVSEVSWWWKEKVFTGLWSYDPTGQLISTLCTGPQSLTWSLLC